MLNNYFVRSYFGFERVWEGEETLGQENFLTYEPEIPEVSLNSEPQPQSSSVPRSSSVRQFLQRLLARPESNEVDLGNQHRQPSQVQGRPNVSVSANTSESYIKRVVLKLNGK